MTWHRRGDRNGARFARRLYLACAMLALGVPGSVGASPAAAVEDTRAVESQAAEAPAAETPATRVPAAGAPAAVNLPTTFSKVWFREAERTGMGKLKAYKHVGYLTVTEDGLDFVGKKQSYFFPIDDVLMVSLGTLGNDTKTEWVVVSVRQEGSNRVIGLRDGHSWGYGSETETIYETLRDALKHLEAGHYRTAEGYQTYDRLVSQIVLHYPEDWSAFVVRSVYVGGWATYGRVIFSPRSVDSLSGELKDERSIPTVELGHELAIVFDRGETKRGMTCDGIAPATDAILEHVADYPVFAEAAEVLAPPAAEVSAAAGCEALTVRGRVRTRDGIDTVVEARVFANRGTLFTLGYGVPAELVEQAAAILEAMIDSIQWPLAD